MENKCVPALVESVKQLQRMMLNCNISLYKFNLITRIFLLTDGGKGTTATA